jgi:hypothetical protein
MQVQDGINGTSKQHAVGPADETQSTPKIQENQMDTENIKHSVAITDLGKGTTSIGRCTCISPTTI